MKCTLSIEINTCPFYNKNKMECSNKENCTFQENKNSLIKDNYARKERWYEKYYRNKK